MNNIIRTYVADYSADRFYNISQEGLLLYKELSGTEIDDGYYLERDDPYFVSIVKQLGTSKASGKESDLRLVNVYDKTIGIVYNPMRSKLTLRQDALIMFEKLSGYPYNDRVYRHDKYLVQVIEKLGDRSVLYPIDMVEIEYISSEYHDSYIIVRDDGFEKIFLLDVNLDT
jgi:hypothetical protein